MLNPDLNLSVLIQRMNQGDENARPLLFDAAYRELQDLARAYLHRENDLWTLDTRALVHEAYLRLFGKVDIALKNRKHFFALVARTMRRIICDHVRQARADKRGGGEAAIRLTALAHLGHSAIALGASRDDLIFHLNEILEKLEMSDPDMARLIELKFFYGMTVEETARALGLSTRTVNREWRLARAYLYDTLSSTFGLRGNSSTATAA